MLQLTPKELKPVAFLVCIYLVSIYANFYEYFYHIAIHSLKLPILAQTQTILTVGKRTILILLRFRKV